MADLRLTDINKAAKLFEKLVGKADLNQDGAIRSGDVERIRSQPGVGRMVRTVPPNETQVLCSALDSFRRSAAAQGGPTLDNIHKLLGQAKDKLRTRDKDGDGVVSASERPRTTDVCEAALLFFAESCKGLKVTDFKLPDATPAHPPHFSWSGTPAKVCQSLLDAFSKPANDNQWPAWARPESTAHASRYVVDRDEAKAMVEALRPLYAARQKAVLTELASRTETSTYGCVSPTATALPVFKAFATELGLTLTFKQPKAPSMPSPS